MAAGVTMDAIHRVADALMYEGYLLYPYRASAAKNQARWQFGVLVPPGASVQTGDASSAQVECILEAEPDATVHVEARFLRLQTRGTWDEAEPRAFETAGSIAGLASQQQQVDISLPVEHVTIDDVEYERAAIEGLVRVAVEPIPGPYGIVRVRASIHNTSQWTGASATRPVVVRRSLVGAHLVLAVDRGTFISSIDPPEWASAAVAECTNEGLFPVVADGAGRDDMMLASPIIVYDHPELAPESPGDLFDATEIDEILTLRTLALTDAEKEEARATDARAASIIDRTDTMPPQIWERLHGAIRTMRPKEAVPDVLLVDGVQVSRGDLVRLAPQAGRADAQDMFLAGRLACVETVRADVDGGQYLAVTLLDDPAADLQRAQGRFLYFSPSEVEVLR